MINNQSSVSYDVRKGEFDSDITFRYFFFENTKHHMAEPLNNQMLLLQFVT